MGAPRVLAVLAFFLIGAFAGCLSDDSSPTRGARSLSLRSNQAASGDIELEFVNDQFTTIRLEGTGWRRVTVRALEDIALNVTVAHDGIPDLEAPTPEGAKIYTSANFTAFYLFPADEHPRGPSTYYFEWLGDPINAGGASQSRVQDRTRALQKVGLSAGANATLLLATSVAGYRLEIETIRDVETIHTGIDLPLRQHPRVRLFEPTPTEAQGPTTAAGDASRRIEWVTEKFRSEPALLIGWGWNRKLGAGTGHAEMYSDRYGFDGPPSTTAAPTNRYNGPESSVGGQEELVLTETKDVEMYRVLERTAIGIQPEDMGARFLAIPLDV